MPAGVVDDNLGRLAESQPGQRGHLGQPPPLQAGHGGAEAEPGGGGGEALVKRPVMMGCDLDGAAFGAATMHFLEGLGFFYGLGIVIVFYAALALGQAAAARTTGLLAYQPSAADLMQSVDEYHPAH